MQGCIIHRSSGIQHKKVPRASALLVAALINSAESNFWLLSAMISLYIFTID